jgi:hypothetical protein
LIDEGVSVEVRALIGSLALVASLAGVAVLVQRSSGATLAEEDPRTTVAGSMRMALPLALGLTAVTAVVADGWGWYALYLGLVALGLVLQWRYLKVRKSVRSSWGKKRG